MCNFVLGSRISAATDVGNFSVLLLSTIVKAKLVVSVIPPELAVEERAMDTALKGKVLRTASCS